MSTEKMTSSDCSSIICCETNVSNDPSDLNIEESVSGEGEPQDRRHGYDDENPNLQKSYELESDDEEDVVDVDKAIFGEWGCHYSLRHAWSVTDKPTVKVFDYSKMKLNDMETGGILTDRIMASCSSYLTKSPYVNKYALCKCVLSNKLLKNVDLLTYHHYLQYLDVSNNEIKSLKPLSELPFLMYLDASRNLLTELLDFKAPFYLNCVNYASNNLTKIPDLSDFWSIVNLDLSHNKIKSINGLHNLKYLRNLNLSFNEIELIENVNNKNLQILKLQNNKISKFEKGILQNLYRLITLNLSHNQLSTMKMLRNVYNLREIDMTNNQIDCLMEINYLRTLPKLNKLDLKENPIYNKPDYYRVCLDCVHNLCFLDGCYVTLKEKVTIRLQFEQLSNYRSNVVQGRLSALEHLQSPFIGYNVVPVDQPPPAIMVLVGTIGSKKGELVREFCKENPKYTVIGVSHTTRQKSYDETNDESYHFVTMDEFRDLLKQGKFLTVYEISGNCYGFAESELEKVAQTNKVLVTHLSLEGALLLRNRGLNPTLILAMPLDPSNHLDFLRYKYYQTLWDPNHYNVIKIIHCPEKAAVARELEEKMGLLFNTNICKSIIEDIVNELPETLLSDDEENSESIYSISKPTSTESGFRKYQGASKGFTVKFENITNDTVSVESDCYSTKAQKDGYDFSEEPSQDDTDVGSVGDSISKALLGDDQNLLSVLSKVGINTEILAEDRKNLPRLGMKLDQLRRDFDFLDLLYFKVLWFRESYFEEYNKNPGLFSGLVFTDDLDNCLVRLKDYLKKMIENRKNLHPTFILREDDSVYQTIIRERQKQLQIALKRSASIKYDLMKELEEELEVSTAPYFKKVDRPPDFTQTKTLFKK